MEIDKKWGGDLFHTKPDFLARSFSLPCLVMVDYSSGYLLFISYLTMIESCINNKRKSIEITSLQERKNSPLGGHELTCNE